MAREGRERRWTNHGRLERGSGRMRAGTWREVGGLGAARGHPASLRPPDRAPGGSEAGKAQGFSPLFSGSPRAGPASTQQAAHVQPGRFMAGHPRPWPPCGPAGSQLQTCSQTVLLCVWEHEGTGTKLGEGSGRVRQCRGRSGPGVGDLSSLLCLVILANRGN